MFRDSWLPNSKEVCYLHLRQPHRLILQTHFKTNRVVRVVKDNLILFFR